MNESIEDERGLMSKSDFKKMFTTSFKGVPDENIKIVYDMIMQLIQADPSEDCSHHEDEVSIGKLSNFIDFYNYYPFFISSIKKKNDSSEDLYLFMGKPMIKGKDMTQTMTEEEKDKLEFEKRQFMKVLALISDKINERFKNILTAFRNFDSDHGLNLTLNEFAQGIDHLRIKISFDYVKKVFNYLDSDNDGEITFKDFRALDEENWRKIDMRSLLAALTKKDSHTTSSVTTSTLDQKRPSIQDMTFNELESLSKKHVSRNMKFGRTVYKT